MQQKHGITVVFYVLFDGVFNIGCFIFKTAKKHNISSTFPFICLYVTSFKIGKLNTHTHFLTHIYKHTQTHTNTQSLSHTHTHTHMHTLIGTHTHIHTHTHMHTYTHIHICTHIHTCI